MTKHSKAPNVSVSYPVMAEQAIRDSNKGQGPVIHKLGWNDKALDTHLGAPNKKITGYGNNGLTIRERKGQ